MQDTSMLGKTTSRCLACGKEIVIRDIREKKGRYCSQVCASQARFLTRYRGTMSGPLDRPADPMSKRKWEGGVANVG